MIEASHRLLAIQEDVCVLNVHVASNSKVNQPPAIWSTILLKSFGILLILLIFTLSIYLITFFPYEMKYINFTS